MNWAAVQAVAEAVGAIAVVASLIYLAILTTEQAGQTPGLRVEPAD